MAIKTSNQITFSEQKKVLEIREWYLATSKDSGVTRDPEEGWTLEVQTINKTKKYLWNYEEVVYSIGSSDQSDPVIIGIYGESGSSLQVKYISSASIPIINANDVSDWSDVIPSQIDGEKIYMIQKLSTDINWSTPIQISGTDGTVDVKINDDGYWVINGESTGVKAEGDSPEVTIGENGNWFINGVDSGNKAQGEAGKDGSDIEYVYYRNNTGETPATPQKNNGALTTGWEQSPQGVSEILQYEYVSVRRKPSGINAEWESFSAPVVWSKWGEKGQDGDGIEYKYCRIDSPIKPSYPTPSNESYKWTDDPQGVSELYQYEYVVQIKTTVVDGTTTNVISDVSLWAKYGADGRGIDNIKNYYATTTTADTPPRDDDWELDVKDAPLSPTNKYLWNYEVITYTDNSNPTITDPAIIGAYGDSGADVIDFQIYSVDGFEFSDSLTSIELKTVAFKGGSAINGTTYQWKWWNSFSTLEDKYENIQDATSPTLVVNSTDSYALSGLKCEMTYNDIVCEDYVSLTNKTIIYTPVVKFFDGSNIFTASDLYIVAYIDLYKNNEIVESALDCANTYCTGVSTVSSTGVITSDVKGNFSDGDTMYFVCKNGSLYDVVLGEYTSGSWKKVNYDCKYIYTNSLYLNIKSNVIAISKESINKAQNIDFIIYGNDEIEISRTNINIIDSNDPIIDSQEPSSPTHNQLWLDTSVTPNILRMYDQSTNQWLECSNYKGNPVYTSQPSSYSEGDLWILADGEICGNFGPGSMLKSTTASKSFKASHWIDADESLTSLKNNINQYFSFNASTGLKIGQKDEKFYVNISSTEMGFYDNSGGQNQKVVSISNNAATIKGLTVEDSAKFNCSTTFNSEVNFFGFVWKKESNGSLSLA